MIAIGQAKDRLEPTATVDEARAAMLAIVNPLTGHEELALRDAVNRVVFADMATPIDLPPFSQSAMDGFAVACGEQSTARFRVVGSALAGHPFEGTLAAGECIEITTGACVPGDATAVIAREHAVRSGDWIALDRPIEPGANIRVRGEECRAGDLVISAGRRLRAPQIGVLAASGLATVPVYRRLRVALFSTGDELCPPGCTLRHGEIYDSNRSLLDAALQRLSVDCRDAGALPDDAQACREILAKTAREVDVVLLSGGASVGEADVLARALSALGDVRPWRVAMKPGQRLLFGQINDCLILGLPGNPVAALVAFHQFALPVLKKCGGECPIEPPLRFPARLTRAVAKREGRREFLRAVFSYDEGQAAVTPLAAQGSAMLRGASDANCFIVLPEGATRLGAGDTVDTEPFAAWL